jgi:hypothetical protein
MADTFTSNLVLTKPEVGASADTWGNKLNANSDSIAGLFQYGPALKVANGGTGGVTSAEARTNLGLGTLSTQDASSVAITGGTASLASVDLLSSAPIATFYETDASVDNKRWRFVASDAAFYFQTLTDGGGTTGTVLSVSRSGITPGTVNFYSTLTVSGNTVYHAGNVSTASINETQLVDGSLLARVASNETIAGTWNFTIPPSYAGGGKFLHYNSGTYNSGHITVSTSAPTGTPGNGDVWIVYTP